MSSAVMAVVLVLTFVWGLSSIALVFGDRSPAALLRAWWAALTRVSHG